MESIINLKTVVILLGFVLFWILLLWGFTYYIMLKKFNTVYTMFDIVAKGICSHRNEAISVEKDILSKLDKQNTILDNISNLRDSNK